MNENQNMNTEMNSGSGESGAMYFWKLIFKYKYVIASIVIILTALSVFLSLQMKNQFKATATAVPPNTQASGLGGALGNISSALKDFGLTKLSGEVESGYSLMTILQSRSIKDSLIEKFGLMERYEIENNRMDLTRKELNARMEIDQEKSGHYVLSIWDEDPKLAAEMANYLVVIANDKATEIFKTESSISREYLEYRLNQIDSTLKLLSRELSDYSSEMEIFSPLDQAQAFSNSIAELKASIIQTEILYNIYKRTYGEDDPYTKMQKQMLDQLRQQMKDIKSKPGFAGDFPMSQAAEVGIEYLQLYTEVETYTKVKALLMPMLEKARLDEQKAKKSLIFVDKAIPPEKKDRPKRSVYVAGTFFGSFVLSFMLVMLINGIRNFRSRYDRFNKEEN